MTKSIEYEDDRVKASLVISEATIRHGLKRSILISRASSLAEDETLVAIEELAYANSLAVTMGTIVFKDDKEDDVTKDASDLDLESFLDLPDSLGDQWLRTVYEVNPSWRLGARSGEAESDE